MDPRTDDDEDRIRAKAHELWEAEGRPEGRAALHWEEAKEIVALRDSFGSTLRPLEETVDDPVEPAIAFENQGDVPGLTDLGEGPRGPNWTATYDADGQDTSSQDDALDSVAVQSAKVRRGAASNR